MTNEAVLSTKKETLNYGKNTKGKRSLKTQLTRFAVTVYLVKQKTKGKKKKL